MVRHMHPLHNVPDQNSRDSGPASAGLGSDADFSVTTGEAAEMEQIYVQYLDPIYRFLYSRVGNREDAEDLTSETFLKASRQLDVGRSQASIASWLFTVARTVLADHWRKYYRYGALLPFHDVREDPVREAVPDATHQGETERWRQDARAQLEARDESSREQDHCCQRAGDGDQWDQPRPPGRVAHDNVNLLKGGQ